MNFLIDATLSIGGTMDFSLIVSGLLTLIIMTMNKAEQTWNFIKGTIGIGVLLGKSVTPVVRKVIQQKFFLHKFRS